MKIVHQEQVPAKRIETFPYKGKPLAVRGVSVKWLSEAGPAPDAPEYGLRLFMVEPDGEIPIHNHFYVQTMYVLEGRLIARAHDNTTDAVIEEQEIGPGEAIFIPSMEAHSLANPSATRKAAFLCCIANVYRDEADKAC